MSLIIAVYVPTGIALSGDSRTTGTLTQNVPAPTQQNPGAVNTVQTNIVISDSAEKVLLVFQRFGIGAFGTALVNNMPIAHYVRQYEIINASNQPQTTGDCAALLLTYFRILTPIPDCGFFVIGYDNNDPYVFAVNIGGNSVQRVNVDQQNPTALVYGIVRGGDTAIVDRLLSQPQFNPVFNAMNLQDAVTYTRHLIRTTIDEMRFEPRFATVGGPIDTLIVTPGSASFLERKILHP
jgi:hypothetical protein